MRLTNPRLWIKLTLAALLGIGCWNQCQAIELDNSFLNEDRQRLKYNYASTVLSSGSFGQAYVSTASAPDEFLESGKGQKSPFKAFLLSAAVPGLGQFYYGSKVKAGIFFGAEVATWALHVKWHNDGSNQEDEFEQFNRDHWSQATYEQYLFYAYGVYDDEQVGAQEVTHHLPDTRTQQYYEMTGKYDQFAWGWDDATRDGDSLSHFAPPNNTELAITGPERTPVSARRLVYETMRDKSNKSFDKASKMIIAAIANRVISAFEAYFVTKHRNDKTKRGTDELSRPDDNGELHFRASLKSYHSRRDTPYLRVTYKF